MGTHAPSLSGGGVKGRLKKREIGFWWSGSGSRLGSWIQNPGSRCGSWREAGPLLYFSCSHLLWTKAWRWNVMQRVSWREIVQTRRIFATQNRQQTMQRKTWKVGVAPPWPLLSDNLAKTLKSTPASNQGLEPLTVGVTRTSATRARRQPARPARPKGFSQRLPSCSVSLSLLPSSEDIRSCGVKHCAEYILPNPYYTHRKLIYDILPPEKAQIESILFPGLIPLKFHDC